MLATVLTTIAFVIPLLGTKSQGIEPPLGSPNNGRIDSLGRGNICIATVRVAARQLSHSAIVEGLREARLKLNRFIVVSDSAVVLAFFRVRNTSIIESLGVVRFQ